MVGKLNNTWQRLGTAAGTYTIAAHHQDFMVEVSESATSTDAPTLIKHNVFAIRPQLGTTAKVIAEVVENPDGSSARRAAVSFRLASATSLVIANVSTTGNASTYPIQGVYAR